MGYNSISGYSTTRLTGLSSGLDTDSLIKAAMTASQSKLDKMYQNKTKLEWKRDAYTDVRTKVSDFSNKFMSVLSPDNIFSKSAYKQYKVSISDKYDNYFSVKGTSSAQAGSHSITKATLATNATISGAKYRNRAAGLTGNQYTNSQAKPVTSAKLYVLKDGVTAASATDKDYVVLDKNGRINETNHTNVALDKIYVKDGTQFKQAFGSDKISFTVNGKNVDGGNLQDLMDDVNKSGTGVNLSITDNGELQFTSTTTGDKSGIKFGQATGAGLFGSGSALGITKTEYQPEPLVTDLSATSLGDLAGLRDTSPALDGNNKPVGPLVADTYRFKINGKEFTFNKHDKLQEVLDDVNKSDANVVMSFENGQFSLRSKDSSGNATIKTENVAGSPVFFGGDDSLTGIAVDETTGFQNIDRSKDTIASALTKMGMTYSGSDKISFTLTGANGKERTFSFDKNTTLDKMMSEINSDADLKVRMTYSQISDSFEITSLDTGHAATVGFKSDDANALNLFGFYNKTTVAGAGKDGADLQVYTDAAGDPLKDAAGNYVTDANLMANMDKVKTNSGQISAKGTDATLEIDGETITRSSNKFVIDGMEITIKDNFVADLDGTGVTGGASENGLRAAKFSVEQDVDSVVDKVKAFVTAYNELVDSLYGMTTEAKDYDYDALTEDQRDNMEKEDIEKWEAEAKKGILRNDTTIRSFLSKMRNAIFEKIGGTGFNDITGDTKDTGLSAYDLGFNTSKYEAGKYGGRLTFDEEKFRAALERDPEAVANVMAQVSEATDSATEYKESGFITKLYDAMSGFTNTMRGKNIANVNQQITDANKAMQNQIKKMYEEQERYYKQYAALESLMTSYQNQMQWMTQQFAAMKQQLGQS